MRPLRIALALLVLAAGRATAGDPPSGSPTQDQALEALRSPLLQDRAEAVARLVELLPGSRAAVIARLAEAGPAERLELVEVLARDASEDSVRALLRLLDQDGPLASRVALLLAKNPKARQSLAALRAANDPAARPSRRLEDLEALLLRAEVERVFVARRSKTGYTGYYRGQYAALDTDAYRSTALLLCLRILQDQAMPVPGTHTAGGFAFLDVAPEELEFAEAQSMAANAIIELAEHSEDRELWVGRLDRLMRPTDRRADELLDELERDYKNDGVRRLLWEARGLWIDLLVAAFILAPDEHAEEMEQLLRDLRPGRGVYWYLGGLIDETRAQVLLRIGRYEEAVEAYGQVLASDDESKSYANSHYNLACAYASWSLAPGDRDPADLRRMALRNLALAVERGRWSDVGWMEQDRDLDPIRDMRGYSELVKRMREENLPR